MLYFIIRPIIRLSLRFFYKKIHISNIQNIPVGQPVILAANHPTAFIEPCVLACHLDYSLSFLVRGDFFKKKVFAKIMNSLHMLPVYRQRDRGFTFIKQNFSTFSACHDALSKNSMLMILAEGSTEHEKRLRPLVKGTSRIAFGTLEAYPETVDVYVVPVGVNYTYAERSRSSVYIDFGKAISVRAYDEEYQKNTNKAMVDLTNELQKRLTSRVIIIEKEADEDLVEQLFLIARNFTELPIFPILSDDKTPLEKEKKISNAVNNMDASAKAILQALVNNYTLILKEKRVEKCVINDKRWPTGLLFLYLFISFPIFLMGYIFAFPPIRLSYYVVNKTVKDISFRGSVLMATEAVTWLLYFIGLVIISVQFSAYYLCLLPFFSAFSVIYDELYERWKCRRKVNGLSEKARHDLVAKRDEIWSKVIDLM